MPKAKPRKKFCFTVKDWTNRVVERYECECANEADAWASVFNAYRTKFYIFAMEGNPVAVAANCGIDLNTVSTSPLP